MLIDPKKYDLGNVPEPTVLPKGTEVKLRITSVRTGTWGDDDEHEYVAPNFDIPEHLNAQDVSDFMTLPDETMTPKEKQKAAFKIQSFYQAFKISLAKSTDPADDWPGKEGWAILGAKSDDEYGDQNTIRKYVIGR